MAMPLAGVIHTQLLAAEACHLQGNGCQSKVHCLSWVIDSGQLSWAVSQQCAQAHNPLTCAMQDLQELAIDTFAQG